MLCCTGRFREEFSLDSICRSIEQNEPTLRGVTVLNEPIGDDGAVRIAAALKENDVITKLDLAQCGIGDKGAQAIADMLLVNKKITWIRLAANKIGSRGGTAIAEALEQNTLVNELYLGSTMATQHNELGNEGAKAMAKMLGMNTKLNILGLAFNSVGDEGAISLAEALPNNQTLVFLRLAENNIGDVGATAFADALRHRSSNLKQLGLFANKITDSGAIQLSKAMHHNRKLTSLGLGCNPFGPIGTSAILGVFEYNSTLTFVDHPHFKWVTEGEWQSFEEMLKQNKEGRVVPRLGVPGSRTSKDWKRWIIEAGHETSPSMELTPAELLPFGEDDRPYDVFLINTGELKYGEKYRNDEYAEGYMVPMRWRFESSGLRTFLDDDMRDVDGAPVMQMRKAIRSCRFAVSVITRAFLFRKDPRNELEYAFKRMEWLQDHYGWRSLKVVFVDISINEYNEFRNNKHPGLPDLGADVVFWESEKKEKYDSWEQVCDEIKADMVLADERGAVDKWKQFLSDWPHKDMPKEDGLYFSRGRE